MAALSPCLLAAVVMSGCAREPWPDPPPMTAAEHDSTHTEWRQNRRDGLVRAPFGAVLWAGLWRLEEGATPFGSDASLPIVLPVEDAPPLAGTLHRSGMEVRLEPAPGAQIRVLDGDLVTGPLVLDNDRSGQTTTLEIGSIGLRVHAEPGTDRLWLRASDMDSPLIETFALPEQYPLDAGWRVAARFDSFPEPRHMPAVDVTGGVIENRVPGELVFELDGDEHRLLVVADTNSTTYFIMMWDSTALTTTYEPGRYLRAPLADSTGWTTLDFNRAYNPSCVFSAFSVCAFAPEQNRLPMAVTAGEKKPPFSATPPQTSRATEPQLVPGPSSV